MTSEGNHKGLFKAIFEGDLQEVTQYLDSKPEWLNPKSKDLDGFSIKSRHTPLSLASVMGYLEIVKLMVSRGARVDQLNMNKETPLMVSASLGHLDILSYLIQKGAQINRCNKEGQSVLMRAAISGQTECMKSLIAAGALLDTPDMKHQTALTASIWYNHLESATLLIKAGAVCNENAVLKVQNDRNTEVVKVVQGMLKARKELEELSLVTQKKEISVPSAVVGVGDKEDPDAVQIMKGVKSKTL